MVKKSGLGDGEKGSGSVLAIQWLAETRLKEVGIYVGSSIPTRNGPYQFGFVRVCQCWMLRWKKGCYVVGCCKRKIFHFDFH